MSETTVGPEEEVLSDLSHKLVDQVALYGIAKDRAHDSEVVAAIQRAKEARAQLLQDITGKIWLREITAIDQGIKLGSASKAFERVRAVGDNDDRSALAEVQRGEEYLRDRVAKAAQDERLTAHTRNYLQTVVSRIDSTLSEISQLKRSLE